MAKATEKLTATTDDLLGSIPPTDPAILRAFENNRLANRHYAAIGQVAALWAYFEAVVATWMITFANVDPDVGVCFTAQMLGSRGRVDGFHRSHPASRRARKMGRYTR